MANGIFGVGRPLGPAAQGLSGAINPLMFLGSGMATGNIGGSMGQLANIQQNAQQLSLQRQQMAQDAIAQRAANIIAQQRLTHQMSKPVGTSLEQNLAAAGLTPGTTEYQQAVMDYLAKPTGVTVQNIPAAATGYHYAPGSVEAGSPRLVPTPGGPVEQKLEAEKRKQLSPVEAMEQSLDAYEALLDEHGPEILPGPAKYQLQTAYTSLLLEAKELANLGALTGPDLDLIQAMMEEPTSIKAQAMGAEGLKAQLKVIRDKVRAAKQRVSGQAPEAAPLPPGFVEE